MDKLTAAFHKLTDEEKFQLERAFFENALDKPFNSSGSGFFSLYDQAFSYEKSDFLNFNPFTNKHAEEKSILYSFLNDKQKTEVNEFYSLFDPFMHKKMIDTAEKLLADRSYANNFNYKNFFSGLDSKSLGFIIQENQLKLNLHHEIAQEMDSANNLINLFSNFEKASIFKKFKIKNKNNEKIPFLSNSVESPVIINYQTTTPLDYAVAIRNTKLVAFLIEKGHPDFRNSEAITSALTLALLDRNKEMVSYIYNNHNSKIDYNKTRDKRESFGKNLLTASLINYIKTRDDESFAIFLNIAERSNPDINNKKEIIGEISKLLFFKKNKSEHLQVLHNVLDIALKHNFDKEIHQTVGQHLVDVMYKGMPVNSEEIKKIHQIVQLFNYSHGRDSVYCKSIANQLSNNFFSNTDILAKKELLKTKLNQDMAEHPEIKKNSIPK